MGKALSRYRITNPEVIRLIRRYADLLSRKNGFAVEQNWAVMSFLLQNLPSAIAQLESGIPESEVNPGGTVKEVPAPPKVSVNSVLKSISPEDWE